MPSNKISLLIPTTFKESYIRLYCKNSDKVNLAKNAFEKYLKKFNYVLSWNNNDNVENYSMSKQNNFITSTSLLTTNTTMKLSSQITPVKPLLRNKRDYHISLSKIKEEEEDIRKDNINHYIKKSNK